HTRCLSDWSSDVCSSDLVQKAGAGSAAIAVAGGINVEAEGAVSLGCLTRLHQHQVGNVAPVQRKVCDLPAFDEPADSSGGSVDRSEEHTSELQSLRHLVC